MNSCGLNEKELEAIRSVLRAYSKVKAVKVFGSRAKGNYRRNSDIDLAIVGDVNQLETETIASDLDDLPLPYKFDVKNLNQTDSTELLDHINRVGITIYDSTK